MKISALFLALAVALPLGASAQVPPPPMGHHAPMTDAQRQAFESTMKSFHQKDEALRLANRKQILGALSSSSRALLAQVAGQLATADVPDHKAAVAKLDGALSGSEKQAILAAESSYRTQQKALFEQFRSQMKSLRPSPAPGTSPHAWPSGRPKPNGTARQHKTPTAGAILLMTAIGFHGGMHGGMHGFGGMRGGMHGELQGQNPPPN